MRRPWNRISLPVYSVSCNNGNETNMHICTYVSAISMDPKLYMVALFKGSKTLDIVSNSTQFLLQLLTEEQYRLVPLLGQQSGHHIQKIEILQSKDLLDKYNQFFYLKKAAAILELNIIDRKETGDHVVFICSVLKFKNLNDSNILTTEFLRLKKIIRA
ncbi:MAG: flavin reductase [Chitinophagaceae bacterium]